MQASPNPNLRTYQQLADELSISKRKVRRDVNVWGVKKQRGPTGEFRVDRNEYLLKKDEHSDDVSTDRVLEMQEVLLDAIEELHQMMHVLRKEMDLLTDEVYNMMNPEDEEDV